MAETILAKDGVNEITSAMRVKNIDLSSNDFTWIGDTDDETTNHAPFKIWADGDYTVDVVLWGDYLDYRKANKLTDLETDKKLSLPFSKNINPAMVYRVYTSTSDSSGIWACT